MAISPNPENSLDHGGGHSPPKFSHISLEKIGSPRIIESLNNSSPLRAHRSTWGRLEMQRTELRDVIITEFGGAFASRRGVSTSVMSGLHRIFLGSERLRKIQRSRFLTQLPTSEIARGLFRLTRARRYQNFVREFVTRFGEVSTRIRLSYSDARTKLLLDNFSQPAMERPTLGGKGEGKIIKF